MWGQRPGEGDGVTQRGIQGRRAETQGGGFVAQPGGEQRPWVEKCHRVGLRFSLGQARRMGCWASPLTAPVFLPLPSLFSPWCHCSFPSCAVKISSSSPGSSSHVARLHFLCPEIFISFWRCSYPFNFFFFFASSGFPVPSWPEILIFLLFQVEVFSCSFLGLGDHRFLVFCIQKVPFPLLSLKTFTSSLWSFLGLAVPPLPCLGWETFSVSSLRV